MPSNPTLHRTANALTCIGRAVSLLSGVGRVQSFVVPVQWSIGAVPSAVDPSNPPLNRFMASCTRTTSRCTGTASLLAKARAAEAGAVLVACLDLSGVVRFAETELPIVDAADCLAREIVRRWMSGRQERHLPRRLEPARVHFTHAHDRAVVLFGTGPVPADAVAGLCLAERVEVGRSAPWGRRRPCACTSCRSGRSRAAR